LLLNQGGTLAPTMIGSPGNDPKDFDLFDLDGDGLTDIVAVAETGGFLGRFAKDHSFAGWFALPGLPRGERVAIGDFTGDGVADIAIASGGHIAFYKGVPTRP